MSLNISELSRQFRLLFVDDDEDLRDIYFFIFKKLFSEVYLAKDGHEGLKIYKEKSPDLIITDLNMPFSSGIDFIANIREIDSKQKILVFSAFKDLNLLTQLINLKVDGFIEKSTESKSLLCSIEKTILSLVQENTLVTVSQNFFKSMEKVKNLQSSYEEIFNAVNDGIFIHNADDGSIIDVNRSVLDMFGYTKEELLSKGIGELSSQKIPYRQIDALHNMQVAVQEGSYLFEWQSKRKDGSLFWCEVHLKSANIQGRECIVAITRDITKSKKIKEELKELNKTLEHRVQEELSKSKEKDKILMNQSKYAQMGEMLSMIAHQWRQPLNAISAAAISLSMRQELDELDTDILQEQTDFIQDQANKMSKTINDFMGFLKPQQKQEDFRFSEILNDIKSLMSAQLQSRGIELVVDNKDDFIIHGHKKELSHIIINLISNSKDAYETLHVDEPKIFIKLHKNNNNYEIIVSDCAGGVPEDIKDKIFNPYFTTKEQGKGTGIGLYMTKRLIEEALNGTIEVHNENGGASFKIVIDEHVT